MNHLIRFLRPKHSPASCRVLLSTLVWLTMVHASSAQLSAPPPATKTDKTIKTLSRLDPAEFDLKTPQSALNEVNDKIAERLKTLSATISDQPATEQLSAYKKLSFGFSTLLHTKDVADPGKPVTGPKVVPIEQQGPFEQLVANELLPVVFLERGAIAQRPVGRLAYKTTSGSGAGLGTGFMVSSTLLLTNNHVIPTIDSAHALELQMNYQLNGNGQIGPVERFDLDPEGFFHTDVNLDYTLVRVRPRSVTAGPSAAAVAPGDEYGHVQLGITFNYSIGQGVNVVQHPDGRPKEIAIRSSRLVKVFPNVVRYTADTEGGSSGSPVFNSDWVFIALHHAAGETTPDGVGIDNEGIRGDVIAADIKQHTDPSIKSEVGL